MSETPSPIRAAIQQIVEEKGLSEEAILGTIEAALAAAYRKDFGEKNQNIRVTYSLDTGATRVFDVKEVVTDELVEAAARESIEGVENDHDNNNDGAKGDDGEEEELKYNPKLHIGLTPAREIKKDAEVGEEIRTELTVPGDYGRMAAQTAKQVIIQKLREAEHANVYDAYKDRAGEVLVASVHRRDGRNMFMDLGQGVGLLPFEEQIPRERMNIGDRFKVYLMSVVEGARGPQITLSRSHPEVVRQVFATEIPEIQNELILIKGIAREAGSRSKVAVEATDPNVDPIGSCVGQRGTRVQTIIAELGGEKIDIIEYSEEPVRYISNALSPAKVLTLEIDEEERRAIATVAEDQLSLAIGKGGQNVRLAAKLTGWRIDIKSEEGELQDISESAGDDGHDADAETETPFVDDSEADNDSKDTSEEEVGDDKDEAKENGDTSDSEEKNETGSEEDSSK